MPDWDNNEEVLDENFIKAKTKDGEEAEDELEGGVDDLYGDLGDSEEE